MTSSVCKRFVCDGQTRAVGHGPTRAGTETRGQHTVGGGGGSSKRREATQHSNGRQMHGDTAAHSRDGRDAEFISAHACVTQYQYLYNTVTRRAPAAVSSHVSPIAAVAWRARGSTQARADRGFDTPLLRRELRSSSIASAVGGEVVAVVVVVVDLEVNHSRMNRRRQAIITRGPRTFSVLPEGFSRVGRRSLPASCV